VLQPARLNAASNSRALENGPDSQAIRIAHEPDLPASDRIFINFSLSALDFPAVNGIAVVWQVQSPGQW
jgi:hypothetical protein